MTYDEEREAHPIPLAYTIETRVPSKWLLVDRETGEVWEFVKTDGRDMVPKKSTLEVTCQEIP
jgi:hypothetical protein